MRWVGLAGILILVAAQTPAGPLLPGDPGFESWGVVEGKSGGPLTQFLPDTSHEYDVLHYRYDLDFTGLSLPTPDNSLAGIATVTAVTLINGTTQFRLNFLRPATLSVDSILWAGSRLTYDPADTLNLNINLGRAVSVGETLVIAIHYHGRPANPRDPYIGWPYGYLASTDTSWTHCFFSFDEPVGARSWIPCYDSPYDKATLEMYLTVPNAWSIGSNGLLRWRRDNGNGTTTWFWEQVQPIATYLIMVATSDSYAEFEQDSYNYQGPMKIHYFVNRRDSARAQADFVNLPDMVDWFSQRYGLYPFDKYGMAAVTSPFIGGAMEHQTLTTIISYLIRGDRRYELVWAHELAHMWWGDMVTLQDWPYIMLNEGFATFAAGNYYEHQAGWTGYQSYMNGCKGSYFHEDSIARYPLYNPPPVYLFGSAEYNKGAWVLHMLRHVLGDSTNFFTVMRNYGQDHRHRNATFAEFQLEAELVYGSSLDWFFQPWLYSAGYPEYRWGWRVRDLGGGQYAADVSIRQVQTRQPTTVFTMPVEFTLWNSGDTSGTKRTYRAWVGQPFQGLTFTMGFRPDTLFFDRNNWILKMTQQVPYEAVEREEVQKPVPKALHLGEMKPNPVRDAGEVEYDLPYSGQASLRIYNALGQLVRVLVNGEAPAGSHRVRWDGKDEKGKKAAAGVYFYALETKTGSLMRKVVVVR